MNFALLIAIESYSEQILPKIQFAISDAKQFSGAILELGFGAAQQELLLGEQATQSIIRSRIRKITAAMSPEDTLFLYFTGHGFSDQGRDYLTCFDTQPDDLPDTCIELEWLIGQLHACNGARIAMFLDASTGDLLTEIGEECKYADLDHQELEHHFSADADSDERERVCFVSCQPGQTSWTSGKLLRGAWSHSVTQAFRGQAPEALENGDLLTATSLQNQLTESVQKALHEAYTNSKDQTPAIYQSGSDAFLLADLTELIASQQVAANPHDSQILNMTFLRQRESQLKSLSGFQKHHRIPDRSSGAAESFVAQISHVDIETDLDQRFEILKSAFEFKRKDISASNTGEGKGSIATPYFDYSITISIDPDDPTNVVWRRAVDAIKQPDQIFSAEFAEVFGDLFDTVEFSPPTVVDLDELIDRVENLADDRIQVDYDKNASWCRLTVEGITGTIQVTEDALSIKKPQPESPQSLLQTFFAIQQALVELHDVKAIPFLDTTSC